jgi:hypothetical protein
MAAPAGAPGGARGVEHGHRVTRLRVAFRLFCDKDESRPHAAAVVIEPPGLAAAGSSLPSASLSNPPLGRRLAAADHVVVVEERVRQIAELAHLVVGQSLGSTLGRSGEERHAATGGAGARGLPGPPLRG